mgnify:FL=1
MLADWNSRHPIHYFRQLVLDLKLKAASCESCVRYLMAGFFPTENSAGHVAGLQICLL